MRILIKFCAGAEELRVLLPRGLEVLGAVVLNKGGGKLSSGGRIALELREKLEVPNRDNGCIVAASVSSSSFKLGYSRYQAGNASSLREIDVQEFENGVWDDAIFLRCKMQFKMPLYLPQSATASGIESQVVSLVICSTARFRILGILSTSGSLMIQNRSCILDAKIQRRNLSETKERVSLN